MSAPKYGVQVAYKATCKICSHPDRGDIEDVLYLSKQGLVMEDGVRPTLQWLNSDAAVARWGIRLNSTNVQNHWTRHFKAGNPTEMGNVALTDARTKLESYIRENGIRIVSVDDFLHRVMAVGMARAESDPTTITVDQGLKAASELTKRRSDQARHQLLTELVAAQAAASGGVLESEATEVEELAPVNREEVE